MKAVRTYMTAAAAAMLCGLSASCGSSAGQTAAGDALKTVSNRGFDTSGSFSSKPVGADGQPVGMPADASEEDARTLIVYYNAKVGKKALLSAAGKYGSAVIYDYRNFNAVALSVPSGKTAGEASAYYNKVKGVIQVCKDRVLHLD